MKRPSRQSRARHGGFTMIELVLVIIIMAIIGTYILVRSSANENDLIVQTDLLKSHLRYAQIRAMNDEVPWGIFIPSGGASYVLYRDNIQATSLLPGENAQTHTLPTAIVVSGGAGSTVNFNRYGIPVDTAGNPMPSTQTITLAQGGTTSRITITENTGYIP